MAVNTALARILRKPEERPLYRDDDITVLGTHIEYGPDGKTTQNMIYRMVIRDVNGEAQEVYKVVRLLRVIRLPKSARQSLVLMDMHAQVLAGLWERGINLMTVIANIIEPNPLGLLFCYGTQAIHEDLETAKRMAANDFAALRSLLQGTYRTLEFRNLNSDEIEWLRQKMYSMKHLTMLRGLPKARAGGADGGNKGMGGKNVNPASQETSEEFIAGMSDREYVVIALATPVAQKALESWLHQTARQMTIWNGQLAGSKNINFGINIPMMYMANMGTSNGWSHGYSDAESVGHAVSQTEGTSYSESVGHSLGINQSESVGTSQSIGRSASIGMNESESVSLSRSHTEGTSYSESVGENHSFTHGRSVGESIGMSQGSSVGQSANRSEGISISEGVGSSQSQSIGGSQGRTDSQGTSANWGRTHGTSGQVGASGGLNVPFLGANANFSGSAGINSSRNMGEGISQSTSEQLSHNYSNSQGISNSLSNSQNSSLSVGQSVSESVGTSFGRNVGESWSESQGSSFSRSAGVSTSDTIGISRGSTVGKSFSEGISTSEGISASRSQGTSESISQSFSKGRSISQGITDNWGRTRSESTGLSGSLSQGTSASMGLGYSLGLSKSYQWLDQEVQNILTMLEFQNERLMRALNGNGAFFTDIYIATATEEDNSAAQALAKSAWYDDSALVSPLQVMDLTEDEQAHLLYHMNAFSADIAMEGIPGQIHSYRYSTILLPEEYTAYGHLPRISEGGVFADVLDVPIFAVPSMRKGEIYMGKILSGERYTVERGYETPFDYRIASNEIMHGFFTGESRSGKTVAATRFIAELAHKVRRESGKRMRIVCMDPKQDWRILAHFIEPERFKFYSMGNPDFCPINLNVCKIPKNVYPQQWIDGLIEIFCRAYGLGERGKSILAETCYELYDNAGVFEEDWREYAPKRSASVTLPKIYRRMLEIKQELESPRSKRGKIGNDVRDAYSRVLDRLQVFGRPFTIEYKLFGQEDGLGIDDLIGADDVVVLESYGLENTFKNFIFGAITSGFFKYAQGHEGGFKAHDQYETILVIEEANEVLLGQDTASGKNSPLGGPSEFEKILDQAAGLGLFIFSITQKISDMPKSVIANSGLVFAGKISIAEDVETVIRKIGREERYDDRDLLKWFPRSPIGWFVCRSSRNFDIKDVEPVLVKIDPLPVDPPTNQQLSYMLAINEAKKMAE